MTDLDGLMDIGEGAFHSDEENRRFENETPEDLWEQEFEQINDEEVV